MAWGGGSAWTDGQAAAKAAEATAKAAEAAAKRRPLRPQQRPLRPQRGRTGRSARGGSERERAASRPRRSRGRTPLYLNEAEGRTPDLPVHGTEGEGVRQIHPRNTLRGKGGSHPPSVKCLQM